MMMMLTLKYFYDPAFSLLKYLMVLHVKTLKSTETKYIVSFFFFYLMLVLLFFFPTHVLTSVRSTNQANSSEP